MIAVVVPPLGIVLAMGLLWGIAFHWVDVALFAALYVVCAFGTTIGFHRYFTHHGFEARAPVKAALAILGCMTMQGPVTQWVTDHRRHHALSDKPGDPHSPHVGHGDGAWGAEAASFWDDGSLEGDDRAIGESGHANQVTPGCAVAKAGRAAYSLAHGNL